jgi:hypothetical protein
MMNHYRRPEGAAECISLNDNDFIRKFGSKAGAMVRFTLSA